MILLGQHKGRKDDRDLSPYAWRRTPVDRQGTVRLPACLPQDAPDIPQGETTAVYRTERQVPLQRERYRTAIAKGLKNRSESSRSNAFPAILRSGLI